MSEDPSFAALKRAKIGVPALVHTPEGDPALWLVPVVRGELACGFAHVGLEGAVIRLGIFGATPQDRASWVPSSLFEQPPADVLGGIKARYPGLTLSEPLLSYDRNPIRWGWRLEVTDGRAVKATVLITAGGWYALKPDEKERDAAGSQGLETAATGPAPSPGPSSEREGGQVE